MLGLAGTFLLIVRKARYAGISPMPKFNPLEYLNFPRWCVNWKNIRQMDKYIGSELDKRYSEYGADPENTRSWAVIDLVIQACTPQDRGPLSSQSGSRLPPICN